MKDVIVITGASRGLGKALTLHYAKQGYRLGICARNEEELMKVKEEAIALGAEVVAVRADVANAKDVDRFVSVVEATFGTIDILLNNASIFGPGPQLLADYDEHMFQDVLHTNVLNPFLMTKRTLATMLTNDRGLIVSITSAAGKTGFAEWGAYGVSKFAVEGLMQTWADELSETETEVCLVDPGEMNTAMHDIAVPNCDYSLLEPEELLPLFDYIIQHRGTVNGKRFDIDSFLEEAAQ
ncbi:SDR family NAD(P)-dependent oxidoreductase [Shouchella lehensis]|uniref:SDR family oxidoreductase n=1 Tax=Shouchella lehensis TaxID=300825 RepID=A0A4Y7WES0_9BACI|nr:SDR family oxidoreductase [Shouchella lehensis]MBG9785009.1 3-oxoacyl-ACP reductase [Shouchella lehensis]TES46432.1 SDR family oxidoreductase [Shouchella lehensis]